MNNIYDHIIDGGYILVDDVLDNSNYDGAFQAYMEFCDEKNIEPFWPDYISKRSTDLPKLVAGNGSTYAIKTELFLKHKSFLLQYLQENKIYILRK